MAWVQSVVDGAHFDDSIPRYIDYGTDYLWDRLHNKQVTRESLDAYATAQSIDVSGEIGPAPADWSEGNTIDGFPFSDHAQGGTTTLQATPNQDSSQPPEDVAATGEQSEGGEQGGEQPVQEGAEQPEAEQQPSNENEWSKFNSHSELNNFISSREDITPAANWTTMTIAQKKSYLDHNVTVIRSE
jgi:hypothetical protein